MNTNRCIRLPHATGPVYLDLREVASYRIVMGDIEVRFINNKKPLMLDAGHRPALERILDQVCETPKA